MAALKTPGDIVASDTSVTISADLKIVGIFPCWFCVWWLFQGRPDTMFKNIFNGSPVCSVLQMG